LEGTVSVPGAQRCDRGYSSGAIPARICRFRRLSDVRRWRWC